MNSLQKKTAPRAATPETESIEKSTTISITEREIKINSDFRRGKDFPTGETGSANPGAQALRIKVVVQNPGEISRIVTVPNTLEALQELVGGYIEVHHISGSLLLVMDEEGRLKGLPENVRCVQYGTIVGPVFITADQDEDFRSLTTEEIQAARAWLMKHSI